MKVLFAGKARPWVDQGSRSNQQVLTGVEEAGGDLFELVPLSSQIHWMPGVVAVAPHHVVYVVRRGQVLACLPLRLGAMLLSHYHCHRHLSVSIPGVMVLSSTMAGSLRGLLSASVHRGNSVRYSSPIARAIGDWPALLVFPRGMCPPSTVTLEPLPFGAGNYGYHDNGEDRYVASVVCFLLDFPIVPGGLG